MSSRAHAVLEAGHLRPTADATDLDEVGVDVGQPTVDDGVPCGGAGD